MVVFSKEDFPRYICSPMVRYSKLPFRLLVRKYGCQLAFTPMIMADSFVASPVARNAEFSTAAEDRPLIVQFAAKDPSIFAQAAQLIQPYADGVDLNCGCPQRWAMREGYGSCLIDQPQLIFDIVRSCRNAISDSNFSVSIKIRIHEDRKLTMDLCRKAESAGITFLTVHARTPKERKQAPHREFWFLIKDLLQIPVVANGDIFSLEEAENVLEETKVDGVMSARGLLQNPALFQGFKVTPNETVKDFLRFSIDYGCNYSQLHHHLLYMLERNFCKSERNFFARLNSFAAVIDYLKMKEIL